MPGYHTIEVHQFGLRLPYLTSHWSLLINLKSIYIVHHHHCYPISLPPWTASAVKKEQNFINKDGTEAFVFLGSVADFWQICYNNNITLLRTLI